MWRLWIVILVLSALSWLALKVVNKPIALGWVFLFWTAAIWGGLGSVYLLSVWISGL